MNCDSFIFYRSFYEAVKKIPKGEREELYEAIFEYALNGECYAGDNGVAGMVLEFVRPQIDANIQRRKNGMKGAEAGKKGGRPKKPQENPKETPKKPQENPTRTPNVNDNDNVECKCLNDNDEDLKENISINRDNKEKTPKFNFKGALVELGVEPAMAEEWATIRKAKNKVNTELALHREVSQMNKAGLSVADAVNFCIEYQWGQFKAEWYINRLKDNNGIKVEHGYLRSTEEMAQIIQAGRKLYEQSLNYR